MVTTILKALGAATVAASIALFSAPTIALAHQTTGVPFNHTHDGGQQRVITGERYTPTIWVDPDGCEHWVMDDGWEGYMTLKVDRNGKPTCRQGSICATMDAHALFERNGAWLTHKGKALVSDFFNTQRATAYKIIGHTSGHNTTLVKKRANMLAQMAHSSGARIVGIDAYGGKGGGNWKKSQRIEILCLR